MDSQVGGFEIANKELTFNDVIHTLKNTIKNVSAKSANYDITSFDSEHFQLIGQRGFTLAPGMSRNIQVRHISGPHCDLP